MEIEAPDLASIDGQALRKSLAVLLNIDPTEMDALKLEFVDGDEATARGVPVLLFGRDERKTGDDDDDDSKDDDSSSDENDEFERLARARHGIKFAFEIVFGAESDAMFRRRERERR